MVLPHSCQNSEFPSEGFSQSLGGVQERRTHHNAELLVVINSERELKQMKTTIITRDNNKDALR